MRFLLDQDLYAATARHLIELGHDVVRAAELGLSRTDDEALLEVARSQGRLLVTRDRDFGRIVFSDRLWGGGALPAHAAFHARCRSR